MFGKFGGCLSDLVCRHAYGVLNVFGSESVESGGLNLVEELSDLG